MSRREAWLSAGLVFAVALLVRIWAAAQVPFPIPEDATYYWGVARNLAEGRGIVSDTIWSYATPARDPVTGEFGFFFPRPAFEIWLPLPSLLGFLPMLALGSTDYPAATIVPIVLGALVPVLAWRIAADLAEERALSPERVRTLALGAGLVGSVWLPLVLPSALLDSTIVFGVAALVACLLMVRLVRRPPDRVVDARLIALGLAIGVGALARNEAIWVGLTWALVAYAALRDRGSAYLVRIVGGAGLIAVAVMTPWLIRDWLVFGSPLPGQAVANAFSTSGFDIFAWNDPPTLARYLAAGPQAWVDHRVEGFLHNVLSVLVVPGFPVSIVGLVGLVVVGRGTGAAAAAPGLPPDVLDHDAGLPGRHDLGHVPSCVGAGAGTPARERHGRPGRGARVGGSHEGVDAPGGVAWPHVRRPRRGPLRGGGGSGIRIAGGRRGGRIRRCPGSDRAGWLHPRCLAPDHRQPPDVGLGGPAPFGAVIAERDARGRG